LHVPACLALGGVNHNTNAPPMFVAAGSGTPGLNYVLGDHQLASRESPCYNTGEFQDWLNGASDLAGQARLQGGAVDLGAYELRVIMPGSRFTCR
jgi:hypothetical protein